MKRNIVYLDDGRAWVAEIEDERVRVSSLVAWMAAHPGRAGLRQLAGERRQVSPAPQVGATTRGWRAAFVSVLGRVAGRWASSAPHPGDRPAG